MILGFTGIDNGDASTLGGIPVRYFIRKRLYIIAMNDPEAIGVKNHGGNDYERTKNLWAVQGALSG